MGLHMAHHDYRQIHVPKDMQQDWQSIVDYIAQIAQIPAALVMRVSDDKISVFTSSQSQGNPYRVGDSEGLHDELYCETVIKQQTELLVPNALTDPEWDHNPDIKLGMISYCGLPVNWPTGMPFGTICMLDSQKNSYTEMQRQLLNLFKKMLENSLAILYQQHSLERKVEERTSQLEQLNKQLTHAIDQHAAAEELIELQKNYDELTGLPNLHQLQQHFQKKCQQKYKTIAIIQLRLVNFKAINESFGFIASRNLSLQISQHLQQVITEHCYLACLAPDEYCLLFYPKEDNYIEESANFAEKLAFRCNQSFCVADEAISVVTSQGISIYPDDSQDFVDLMRQASAAASECYIQRAKFQFFNPEIESSLVSHLQIEAHLADALHNQELHLFYQPLISVSTGEVIGAEVLLRWKSHLLGHVPPERFIPIAEQSGLIIEIGYFVLRSAIQQLARWKSQYHKDFFLAINLSPIQLKDKTLVQKLAGMLQLYQLDASALELELTENIFFGAEEHSLEVLHQLTDLGIRLSLDDFGTGYSSLSYLHKYPFSTVKIDRSFISEVTHSQRSRYMVEAIISMTKSLDLTIVAEGIETQEQADFVQQCGGDIWQGFFFGLPTDHHQFLLTYLDGMKLS